MKSFLLGSLLLCTIASFSQEVKLDTIAPAKPDSIYSKGKRVVSIETYSQRFNPRKAILFSAVLPGMGQVYNKKYWKVPIVYGGFILLISVVDYYNKQGTRYTNDLFDFLNGNTIASTTPGSPPKSPLGFDENQLRSGIDQARRQRDYFIIITGFFYILQLVDAHVDAHLKEFDLNPKLKVRIEPMMDNNYYTGTSTGVAIKFRF
ncbi:MAG: DUF5683 domain-containing protein [Cyclobacteriaceae bacterium]